MFELTSLMYYSGNGKEVDTTWREISSTALEFSYLPERPGLYKVKVMWNDREISGMIIIFVL
jgi:hypothetical protein